MTEIPTRDLPTRDPIIVAPSPTPFREDDSVDYGAIERNCARWLETPLSGFVLNSENGEESFLSEHEKQQIIRTVASVCGEQSQRKLIIAGIDTPSVSETLRIAETLVRAGADMLRIRIPRLADNVEKYFRSVVPHVSAPVTIIHQMAPGSFLGTPTPLGAPAEVIGELVSLDNVFGYIASADLRFETRVRKFVPQSKRFWMGNGSLLLAGTACGADGACMMFGNVAPHLCRDIVRLTIAGDLKAAADIQMRILEADWQILARGAAGLKTALHLLGFEAGQPRRPNKPCDPSHTERIQTALQAAGLLAG